MYFDKLTRQYQLSKTLRFSLIPQGKTSENIRKERIIEIDRKRKEDYKKVKEILDSYHKNVIETTLKACHLTKLREAEELYFISHKDDKQIKALNDIYSSLRKEIVDAMKKHENYGILFKKELIEKVLPKLTNNQEDYDALTSFVRFTTYFKEYNKVRENLYSTDEKSSTVAYRVIHENLPLFFDNIRTYKMIKELSISVEGMNEEEIDKCFSAESYDLFLTQKKIDNYNEMIGKINLAVNLINQKNIKDKILKKYPKMKELYKQILSDRNQAFMEEFLGDNDAICRLENYEKNLLVFLESDLINEFFEDLRQSMGERVYIKNDSSISNFSTITFGNWSKVSEAISNDYDINYTGKKKGEKYEEEKKKELDKTKSYSIFEIQNLMKDEPELIDKYIVKLKEDIDCIKENSGHFHEVVLEKHDRSKKLAKNEKAIEAIKCFLDSAKEFERNLKIISGSNSEADKNEIVYGEYNVILKYICQVDNLYNMTRNYISKKPFSTEKFKLNFNNPTFLDGWDLNKIESNLGILFTKDNKYYLGIMKTSDNKVFRKIPENKSGDVYRKINYKLLPGPNKMLPKVFFAKSNIDYYKPSEELYKKYNLGTHKKGDIFSLEDCHALIDFFKESIEKNEDWSKFGFHFSDTKTYSDISAFYKEVEQQGYSISYEDVDAKYIDELVNRGSLYLFEIYNKDFSQNSKGKLNLHTIYFKMLFEENNIQDVVYKLNGEAEVFYRPASIEKEEVIVHEAKKPILNKNNNRNVVKESSKFEYDIIKDRRYTTDKFMIHIPITMNFGKNLSAKFNNIVNEAIREDNNINVIGIDRGERNLLYLSVVDPKGNILEQRSLNIIEDKKEAFKTNYYQLLTEKEGNRDRARKNWKTIGTIKELKEGYLSIVIHEIAELILKYNAVIALEDLNFGFKRGRQKVERQVYQKFEKMLIDKLNYLVMDKSREQKGAKNIGGALNAIQLTSPFTTFKALGKQCGCIFYIPAYLTSKIDPTTGFANLFYVRYESKDKAKDFFRKFKKISYNKEKDYFEFKFDYCDFPKIPDGTRTKWTVCSHGDRIIRFRNSEKNNAWDEKTIKPTEELKELLHKYEIEFSDGDDIIAKIIDLDDKTFYVELIHIFNAILQMRNSSIKDENIDYIISPVLNEKGEFYNSNNYKEGDNFPSDADANGAYNIARKGHWALEQIRKADNINSKINLAMTNKEWLLYAQSHIE